MTLLERDDYLEARRSGLSTVASPAGCLGLVSGEAGIGKTSLIQVFVDGQRGVAIPARRRRAPAAQ